VTVFSVVFERHSSARRQSGWFEASIRMDDAGSAGGRA
jgi:hypothetical protein